MRRFLGATILLISFAGLCKAQPVRIVSEFLRFTPSGDFFPQDAVEYPVEVLSPALVPGVWNSFRLVVDVDPGDSFRLYVAQNPANAMQVRAFREVVEKGAAGWQISRRERVLLPYRSGQIPADERFASRANYTFWLDIRPPADFPSRRLKLEAQLLLDNQWFIYPLELRVLDLEVAGAPRDPKTDSTATLLAQTGDLPYRKVLERILCGKQMDVPPEDSPLEQQAAHVFRLSAEAIADLVSQDAVRDTALAFLKTKSAKAWCQSPVYPFSAYGAEWPAIVRNRILSLAGNPD